MSEILTVFSNENISEDGVLEVVRFLGGYTLNSEYSTPNEWVIENGEATVWIHVSKNLSFFNSEVELLKDNYSFVVSSIVQIELNSEDETRLIALNFCKSFMKRYKGSILLDDSFSRYYNTEEILKTEYSDEGLWTFQ